MPRIHSRLAPIADRLGLLGDREFRLLDVGVSGGFDQAWEQLFGARLTAVGVDPLVAEIKRLSAATASSRRTYVAAFVGDPVATPHSDDFVNRVYAGASSSWYSTLTDYDYARTHFNAGEPVIHSDQWLTLDQLGDRFGSFDFVKVDTDGWDFQVLQSGPTVLAADRLVGLQVEVQLHGAPHRDANTFANIDGLLREYGFVLHDLTLHRYSRAALPAGFRYRIPAQTMRGQVMWGDAVYFRVPGSQSGAHWDAASPHEVVTVAILLEAFGFPDNAAALLLSDAGSSIHSNDRRVLLDALTPDGRPYAEFIRRLQSKPAILMPNRLRQLMRNAVEVFVTSRWY